MRKLSILLLTVLALNAQAQGITAVEATLEMMPSTYYSNAAWSANTYIVNNNLNCPWGTEYDVQGVPPTDRLGQEWYSPSYILTDDEFSWSQTTAPYSSDGVYNGLPTTQWVTANICGDIYIRRSFTYNGELPKTVYMSIGHDDGQSQFYINGTLVHETDTHWDNAAFIELTNEQKALIKNDGSENIIAVHVHNNYGGAFADCGLYGLPLDYKDIGNLPLGYNKTWNAKVLFNSEGGYNYQNNNIESTIHGWPTLFEAQSGDVYTVKLPTATNDWNNGKVEFKTPIDIDAAHTYRFSVTLKANRNVDAAYVKLAENEDDSQVAFSNESISLRANVGKTVSTSTISGVSLGDAKIAFGFNTGLADTDITISKVSIYDITADKELWTGTSFYNWCYYYNSAVSSRIADMNIEGRTETMSWAKADFDDSMWQEIAMPVGNAGYMNEVKTIWPGGDNTNYWIRRTFNLDKVASTSRYIVQLCHDDAYTLYVNGHFISTESGWTDGKNYASLEVPARFLQEGNNVIAVYQQQNWGGKFFDCGLNVTENFYEESDIDGDPTKLQINEVQVANIDQFIDNSYNYGSWMEIYNPTDKRVSLEYLYVSDDPTDLKKFLLPNGVGVVPARGYKPIYFDHNSATGTYGEFAFRQVDFKLQTEGGSLYLSDSDGTIISQITYPAAITRCSYARKSLTGTEWGMNGNPTPGEANADCYAEERLEAPVVDTDSRLFDSGFSINVAIPAGATLKYTTDGTAPTYDNGEVSATGRFNITATSNYRFRLFQDGKLPSAVVTRSYIYKDNDYYLPVVSITTNPDNLYDDMIGVYVDGTNGVDGRNHSKSNINMDWERPVNFEYITADGKMAVNQEAEFCISGGWSRHYAPASFKIKATKMYEGINSINYPFFPCKQYNKYKQLLIRNGGNDNNSQAHGRVRDAITQETLISSGFYVDAQDYQPVHVFFNGSYIGQLNLREPNNKYNGTANYGYDDDEMDAFEYSNGYFQMAGTRDAFDNWLIASRNAGTTEGYNYLRTIVDMDEVINFWAAITYVGCSDWICNNNNTKGYRDANDGKFHLTMLDQDWGWSNTQALNNVNGNYGNDLLAIYNYMKQSPEFQRQFVDSYCILNGSVFTPERCEAIGDSICNLVAPALAFEGKEPWTSYNEQKYNMTSASARANRMNALRGCYGLGQGMEVSLKANIPSASLMLNNQPVPFAKLDGTIFAPVTITASAPAGYTFKGWTSGGSINNKEIFGKGSQWQYYDEGSLDAYSWKTSGFTEWKTGATPIGYSSRATIATSTVQYHPTYYFRKTITLDNDPADEDIFQMDLGVDDGYVIYVNGEEAADRYLMPEGNLTYESLATTHAPDPFYTASVTLDASLFHKGENIIAVEVHNNVVTSSDIYWDAALSLTSNETTIVSTSNQLVLNEDVAGTYEALFEEVTDTEERISLGGTPVRINEVSAGNDIYVNEYFKRDDWVELYNTTNKDIDITGMYLSDNLASPKKYQIAPVDGISTTIPANGRLIVWADKREAISQLHAPFKLDNADGSAVSLLAADGSWQDVMNYNAHDIRESFGRYPDGGNNTYTMTTPTIRKANKLSSYDFNIGDLLYPEDTRVTTTISLSQGWNWLSHNMATSVDVDKFTANATILRSQKEELVYDSKYGWIGDITALSPIDGYKLKATAPYNVVLKGNLFDTTTPVTARLGWNWIGCPLANATVISAALANYQATEGDMVVGQTGFATYSGGGWQGSLTSLAPGQAYMLKAGRAQSFAWNALSQSSKTRRRYATAKSENDEMPWMVDIHAYPNVMNIIGQVRLAGNAVEGSNYWVGAFSGDECRGVGMIENDKVFLTIYGEGNEQIIYKVMDSEGQAFTADQKSSFQSLGLLGTIQVPYVFSITGADAVEQTVLDAKPVAVQYYSLNGQRLSSPTSGICIKRTVYNNGMVMVKKVIIK